MAVDNSETCEHQLRHTHANGQALRTGLIARSATAGRGKGPSMHSRRARRPHRTAPAATASVLCAVALAGCSSDKPATTAPTDPSSATSTPRTSTSHASTHSSTTSKPSTTTSSTPTADWPPGVPAAAKAHTKSGAIAYADHYVAAINATGVRPRSGVLGRLARNSCKTCHNYADSVQYYLNHRQHLSNAQLIPVRTVCPLFVSSGTVRVFTLVKSPAVQTLRGSTVVQRSGDQGEGALDFNLVWSHSRWTIAKLFIDEKAAMP